MNEPRTTQGVEGYSGLWEEFQGVPWRTSPLRVPQNPHRTFENVIITGIVMVQGVAAGVAMVAIARIPCV